MVMQARRVKVRSGDGSEDLGLGTYVGDVDVYYIRMPNGTLQSLANAELQPTDVPPGGKVLKSSGNPKILLDSGDTVYGCQVWWEDVRQPSGNYIGARVTKKEDGLYLALSFAGSRDCALEKLQQATGEEIATTALPVEEYAEVIEFAVANGIPEDRAMRNFSHFAEHVSAQMAEQA